MKTTKQISDQIRNETMQSYIRIGVITLVFMVFFIQKMINPAIDIELTSKCALSYLIVLIIHFFWLRFKPQTFINERIMLLMLGDILATALAMFYAGPLSALFVGFFLWYIIGFGMRFGVKYAIVGSLITILAWALLYLYSPYWNDHPYHSLGWLAAFLILPFYYFMLVKRLHTTLKELNVALLKSERLACRDSLTGLANRYHFSRMADDLFNQGQCLTIFMLDLDGFKNVNDQFGHNVGDHLLIEVANSLKISCGDTALVGRLGGDEFIVVTTDYNRQKASALADRILTNLASATDEYGQITASIGICNCPGDADDLSHAKSYADTAMYTAKKLGKNRYHFYSQSQCPEPSGQGQNQHYPTLVGR